MVKGIRKGVLGSDESGKIKGSKGPKTPKDVTLPPIKKAKKDNGGGKGGSPGRPTPDWDKDWPPKTPLKPKLARTRKTNSPNA